MIQVPEAGFGWTRPLFQIGGADITVGGLVTAALVFVVSLMFARTLGGMLTRLVERKTRGHSQGSLRSMIRLAQYGVIVLGFTLALQTLGVQLAALFTAGALFAVAIGFAMQNVIGNFISGVILLLERSIKPGDVVEIGGEMIRIRNMGIRTAIGNNLEDETIIIPSSQLVDSAVHNYTYRNGVHRLRVPVGVTYDSDMKLVRSTLESVAGKIPWRLQDPAPVVLMTAFGASSVDFDVSVWIDDPWNRMRRLSDLHEAVWWGLKDAGITIAFPQLDVHFDAEATRAWSYSGRSDR